jgi:hypothetical protein
MPDGLGRNRPKNFSFTFDNEFLTLVDENDDPRVNQSAITLKRDDNHDQFIMTLKTKIVVSSSADKFSISTLSADDVINSTEIFNIQFLDQCQKNLIRLYEFCFKSRLQQLESSCNQLLSKDEILVVNNSTPSIALNDWFNEFLFLTDFFYFLNNGLVVKSSSQQHFEKLLNSEIIPVHPTLRGTFDSSNCDRKTTVIYDDDCLLNCVSFDFWYLEVVMDHKVKEITFNSQKNHHEDQKSKLKFTLSMRKNCDKIRIFRNEIICSYSKMTDVMFQNVQKKILFDAPNNLNEEITAMNIYSSTIFQKEYLTLFVNSSPPVQLKRNETLLCEFVSKFEIIVDKQKVLNTRAGAKRIFVEDVSSKKRKNYSRKKNSSSVVELESSSVFVEEDEKKRQENTPPSSSSPSSSSKKNSSSVVELESSSVFVEEDEKKRQENTPPSSSSPSSSSKKNISSDNNNIKNSQFLLEDISSESDNNSNNVQEDISSSSLTTDLQRQKVSSNEVIITMSGNVSIVILNLNWSNGYVSDSARILLKFNEDFRNSVYRDLKQATISIKIRSNLINNPLLCLKLWLKSKESGEKYLSQVHELHYISFVHFNNKRGYRKTIAI